MIVQPDFLEHWKTRLLIDLLDDPCAPQYVIRLWSHCQTSKTHGFPRKNPSVLKAICKAPHDAEKFESAIIESGFVDLVEDQKEDMWVVHEWDVVNASLIANWTNGPKGGRPKKKTHEKPMGFQSDNPPETHRKPIREDKIREEKRREEQAPQTPQRGEVGGLVGNLLSELLATGKFDEGVLTAEGLYRMLKNCPEFDKENSMHVNRLLIFVSECKEKQIRKPSRFLPEWLESAKDDALGDLNPERYPGFEKWWAAYPVKKESGELDCLNIWVKEKLEAKSDEVLAVLMSWIRSDDWDDVEDKFIPNPVNFLKTPKFKERAPMTYMQRMEAQCEGQALNWEKEQERRRKEDEERAKRPKLSHEENMRILERIREEERRKEREALREKENSYGIPDEDIPDEIEHFPPVMADDNTTGTDKESSE